MTNIKKTTDNRFLNMFEYDGWSFASRRNGDDVGSTNKVDAVHIVVVSPDKQSMLVTKEYRRPLQSHIYSMPAGLIEGDDSAEDTAIRELVEETGYFDVAKATTMTRGGLTSPGMTDESSAIVVVELASLQNSGQELEVEEDIQIAWVPVNENAVLASLLRGTEYVGTNEDYKTLRQDFFDNLTDGSVTMTHTLNSALWNIQMAGSLENFVTRVSEMDNDLTNVNSIGDNIAQDFRQAIIDQDPYGVNDFAKGVETLSGEIMQR